MSGIGHNGGPPLGGVGWQRHCWRHARGRLLPRMPLEVVRRRVERAAELGLDYRTYAGIRAATGRDVVAFLFSTNALRMERTPEPPPERLAHLRTLRRCGTVVLAQSPHDPVVVGRRLGVASVHAPVAFASWSEARKALLLAAGTAPADAVVLVGAAPFERGWAEAARLAAYLGEERVFGADA